MSLPKIALFAGLMFAASLQAQAQAASTAGTLVIVPAFGEVTHANDQAILTLAVEEFDKDKAAAAARVNQKMKQGVEIVKRADPQAQLKTQGYYTYPVYQDNPPPQPLGATRKPVPAGWRVGQYLEVKTLNLNGLPKTAAAAQRVLSINGLQFGLSPSTTKQLDDQRIAATYQNLNERVAAIAAAMGRRVSDAVLDTVDFEGSGNYAQDRAEAAPMAMRSAMMKGGQPEVQEPSFEPGETTLQMRLVGKLRFK